MHETHYADDHLIPHPGEHHADDDRDVAALAFTAVIVSTIGLAPRVGIIGLWVFGSQLGKAFGAAIIPIAGFFLLPMTTMFYAFMWSISSDKVSGWEWIVVAVAFLLDLVCWELIRRLVSNR